MPFTGPAANSTVIAIIRLDRFTVDGRLVKQRRFILPGPITDAVRSLSAASVAAYSYLSPDQKIKQCFEA